MFCQHTRLGPGSGLVGSVHSSYLSFPSFLHWFPSSRVPAVLLYRFGCFIGAPWSTGIRFWWTSLWAPQTASCANRIGPWRNCLWSLWFSTRNFSISVVLRSPAFDTSFQDLRNLPHSSFSAFSLSLSSNDFWWHCQFGQEATLQSVPTYFLVYIR